MIFKYLMSEGKRGAYRSVNSYRIGTVFMELSADKQEALNAYFRKDHLDPEILLGIFRDVQIYGWYDKGMFDFLEKAWKLSKRLSPQRQVRYVAVDKPC